MARLPCAARQERVDLAIRPKLCLADMPIRHRIALLGLSGLLSVRVGWEDERQARRIILVDTVCDLHRVVIGVERKYAAPVEIFEAALRVCKEDARRGLF